MKDTLDPKQKDSEADSGDRDVDEIDSGGSSGSYDPDEGNFDKPLDELDPVWLPNTVKIMHEILANLIVKCREIDDVRVALRLIKEALIDNSITITQTSALG